MTEPKALIAAMRQVFGAGIGIGVADPKAPDGKPWPEEAAAIARAIPRRQREFAAGRDAARAAMDELGLEPQAVPQAPDRAPIWPAGLVGSIAHCDNVAIAAVAPAHRLQAIGIDIEPASALDLDLWDTICTQAERSWLNGQPARDRGRLAKLIFSAKESVYKAQYTLSGKLIGFQDVEISLSQRKEEFSASFLSKSNVLSDHPRPEGRWIISQGLIISVLILPHRVTAAL